MWLFLGLSLPFASISSYAVIYRDGNILLATTIVPLRHIYTWNLHVYSHVFDFDTAIVNGHVSTHYFGFFELEVLMSCLKFKFKFKIANFFSLSICVDTKCAFLPIVFYFISWINHICIASMLMIRKKRTDANKMRALYIIKIIPNGGRRAPSQIKNAFRDWRFDDTFGPIFHWLPFTSDNDPKWYPKYFCSHSDMFS